MAIVVNEFTPSTTVEETDTIASTDDKFRTIINEAGDYVETETQSVANQLEDRVDVKISELESAVNIKILQLASVDDSTYTADYIDTQNKALYQKSGYTTDTLPEDRWLETNTPNVIVDQQGDSYVIDGVVYSQLGDELVTNGDFSNGAIGWTNAIVVDGKLSKTAATVSQSILEPNKGYLLTFNIDNVTTGFQIRWRDSNTSTYQLIVINPSLGLNKVAFATNQYCDGLLYIQDGSGTIIDNISVRELKQATLPEAPFAPTSTDELLDVYTDGIKTNTPHSKGDIVVCNQFKELISDVSTIIQSVSISPFSPFNSTVTFNISDPSFSEINNQLIYMEWKDVNGAVYNTTLTLTGTQILINTTAQFDEITSLRRTVANYTGDTIYQCIADAPTDTEVTNTSYFQTLDFVSRLDVVYLSATGYGSFKGYKTFTDKEIVEGGSDIIASKYSDRFSKIGDNLYLLDGTTKVTNLQVTASRLNSKYYHPVFNQFGSYKNSSNQFWYSDTTPATSIYEAIAKSVNTTSGRPDGKYANRVYLKNYNGLAPHSTFYARESEFGSDRGLVGLSSGSAVDYLLPTEQSEVTEETGTINVGSHYNKVSIGDYVLIQTHTGAFEYSTVTNVHSWGDITFLPLISGRPANGYILKTSKHPQLLTYGESLTTDLIGDPSNYPTEWKSYLAGGGVTSVNPLLVGQDGTDYTDDSVGTVIASKKYYSGADTMIYFNDATNGTWSKITGRVTNNITNILSPNAGAGRVSIFSYSSYNTPYTQIDPTTITKVNKIHEVVYSGDSYDVGSNNLVLNDVSGIIQTGNNEIVKSLPITAIDNATDVFDYVEDATNTTPTFIKFDATLTDGSRAECIWGSSDGVIDKSNVWARRY